jgi:hypothetical protein
MCGTGVTHCERYRDYETQVRETSHTQIHVICLVEDQWKCFELHSSIRK